VIFLGNKAWSKNLNQEEGLHMRKTRGVLLAAAVLIGTLFASAFAGGGNHYPNGAEGFDAGMVPPPGFHLVHYNLFCGSSSLKDNNDDDVPAAAMQAK